MRISRDINTSINLDLIQAMTINLYQIIKYNIFNYIV